MMFTTYIIVSGILLLIPIGLIIIYLIFLEYDYEFLQFRLKIARSMETARQAIRRTFNLGNAPPPPREEPGIVLQEITSTRHSRISTNQDQLTHPQLPYPPKAVLHDEIGRGQEVEDEETRVS